MHPPTLTRTHPVDQQTITRLNALNRHFYEITGNEFDATRRQAWQGWEALLPYIPAGRISVLDVGCGNGRFALFLSEKRQESVVYHGIDNNPTLLQAARQMLTDDPIVQSTLTQQDVIQDPPRQGSYDAIALFGVLHHVPGWDHRRDFMRILAERVRVGGVLLIAAWRFYEYDRFKKRLVAPDAEEVIALTGEPLTLEKHDYLLDWRRGERALRYCHYVDDDEHGALVAATGLTEIHTFRADGKDGRMNRYSVLRRDAATPEA